MLAARLRELSDRHVVLASQIAGIRWGLTTFAQEEAERNAKEAERKATEEAEPGRAAAEAELADEAEQKAAARGGRMASALAGMRRRAQLNMEKYE